MLKDLVLRKEQNNNIIEILTFEKLEKFEENFINYLDVDEKTLKVYKNGINCFNNYLQENGIKNPNRDSVISFRNMLRETYSSNTVNSYMISVRALFKYLEIHGLYKNIAVDIKGSHYDTTPRKEVLSLEQMQTIYNDLVDIRERAIFGLMISTGLRVCEVSTALIEDIKMYNNEIVLFVLGKKRDSKCDYVKLSNQVLNDLQDYIGNRTSGSIFISTSNENYGRGLSTVSLRKIIKNIFKRYGLDKDTLSCHSLRRSFAVVSYETGSSIYDIQQVLRHQSINTTTRYLKEIDRNKNKTEYNVANAIFG